MLVLQRRRTFQINRAILAVTVTARLVAAVVGLLLFLVEVQLAISQNPRQCVITTPAPLNCQIRYSLVMASLLPLIQSQRRKGRAYQPSFRPAQVLQSWCGALLAITLLGLISAASRYPLVVAPLGASSVLLFGHPESPLAQPRNLLLGNGLAALASVVCVAWFGTAPWVMGLAVALAIAAGQLLRCLHPPAGAVALLGVLLHAGPAYVITPVLAGSVVLLLVALGFAWLVPSRPYPHHWF